MTNRPVLERLAPVLGVDDIGAAIDYYTRVLGFTEGWRRGSPPVIAQVVRDDVEVRLARRVGSNTASIYLYVAGVDAYYAEVRARGGEIVEPIGDRTAGAREFAVRDPAGNTLSFGEPLRPPGRGSA